MQIRQGKVGDLRRLTEIEELGTAQYHSIGLQRDEIIPRTEEDLHFLLTATTLMVAEVDHQVVGYISYYPLGHYLHLEEHVVHPDWQRIGIGKMLLNYYLQAGKLLGGCKSYSLMVFPEAKWAWKCYSKTGFGTFDLRNLEQLDSEPLQRLITLEQKHNYSRNRVLMVKTKV